MGERTNYDMVDMAILALEHLMTSPQQHYAELLKALAAHEAARAAAQSQLEGAKRKESAFLELADLMSQGVPSENQADMLSKIKANLAESLQATTQAAAGVRLLKDQLQIARKSLGAELLELVKGIRDAAAEVISEPSVRGSPPKIKAALAEIREWLVEAEQVHEYLMPTPESEDAQPPGTPTIVWMLPEELSGFTTRGRNNSSLTDFFNKYRTQMKDQFALCGGDTEVLTQLLKEHGLNGGSDLSESQVRELLRKIDVLPKRPPAQIIDDSGKVLAEGPTMIDCARNYLEHVITLEQLALRCSRYFTKGFKVLKSGPNRYTLEFIGLSRESIAMHLDTVHRCLSLPKVQLVITES